MTRPAAPAAPPLEVVALLPRDRPRAMLRTALPRRRARLSVARTAPALDDAARTRLVDAAVVHLDANVERTALVPLIGALPSVAFFALVSPVPADGHAVGRALEEGFVDVLVDGVDDAAIVDLVEARGFTARFRLALAEPPARLSLTSGMQRRVWTQVVARAGRAVTTTELAAECGVTREHLSRSFAADGAPTLKRVIDLVRVTAAAELAKNPGFDVADVARVLGFASSSHLSATAQRVAGARAGSLARLRTVDLIERFTAQRLG